MPLFLVIIMIIMMYRERHRERHRERYGSSGLRHTNKMLPTRWRKRTGGRPSPASLRLQAAVVAVKVQKLEAEYLKVVQAAVVTDIKQQHKL